MDARTRAEYEAESIVLRAELKQWEGAWAQTHQGKKPSRDDIKQHPDVAQKYKSYNKVRDILSGKIPPPPVPQATATAHKRKSSTSLPTAQTPSKRLRTTPSVPRFQDSTTTPSTNRKLFHNPTPTSIGPTPQRDGRVLGLFDLLSADEATPSRPRTGDFLTGTGIPTVGPQNPSVTPRKQTSPALDRATSNGSQETPGGRHHGRTPMSSSKRHMLDNFLYTPLKNRDNNIDAGGTTTSSFSARIGISKTAATTPKGPGSVTKNLFATPAFLKRNSRQLDPVDKNMEDYLTSPRPLRLPRKPIARGLSSVVAGLRKLEEERLDDDLEALREMEGGNAPPPPTKPKQTTVQEGGKDPVDAALAEAEGEVEVEDSQLPKLLGGFDDEAIYDSDEGQQLDRGQPLRVFKKKGQKRTTRRVNMKPTRTARLELPQHGDEGDEDVVPETQFAGKQGADAHEDLSGSDYGSGGENDDEPGKKKATKKKSANKEKNGDQKEGTVKKAVRKVKATAHANFKRLKLRSYGAKGGPGQGSRFKRRR